MALHKTSLPTTVLMLYAVGCAAAFGAARDVYVRAAPSVVRVAALDASALTPGCDSAISARMLGERR